MRRWLESVGGNGATFGFGIVDATKIDEGFSLVLDTRIELATF